MMIAQKIDRQKGLKHGAWIANVSIPLLYDVLGMVRNE